MIAVINIIDHKTGRVIQPEYRMPPTDVNENELSIKYDFHFCINVAKPLFNEKRHPDDRF